MQIAVRSTYTAGVALMGAGVIAVSPVSPPLPDIHLPAAHTSAVQLAALAQVNPLTQWEQVITQALQNTQTLVGGVLADPAPVLGQIVKNQISSAGTLAGSLGDFLRSVVEQLGQTPGYIGDGLKSLASGHITEGLQTLFEAVLLPIVTPIISTTILTDVQAVIRKPVQNLLNVIDSAITSPTGLGWLLTAGFPVLTIMSDAVTATGDSLQRVLDSVKAGNLIAAVGAVLAIPGTITGALLNGYNDDAGGLLGAYGLFAGLRNALHIIATAIKPTSTPPVAATGVAATSVAVDKVSATKAVSLKTLAGSAGVTLSAEDTAAAVGKVDTKIEAVTEPVTETKAEVEVVTPAEKTTEKQVVISTTDAADVTADAGGTQLAPAARADRVKRGSHQKSSTDSTNATSTRSGASTKRDRAGAKSGGKSAAGSHGRGQQSRHAGGN